jgi:hypothetical protein
LIIVNPELAEPVVAGDKFPVIDNAVVHDWTHL